MIKPARSQPLILIVDDVAENIRVLGNVLQSEPVEITVATGGDEALAIAREDLPDLILLDIMMPDMNGFEVCECLKLTAETARIPVIFLTARDASEDIIRGFEVGAVDYLTKPFNHAELRVRVRTHLELGRVRRSLEESNRKLAENLRSLEAAMAKIRTMQDQYHTVCAWTQRIKDEGRWVRFEEFMEKYFHLHFTHGISDDALQEMQREMHDKKPKQPDL